METPIAAKMTPKISCKRTRESKTTNHVLCDVLKILEKYPTNKDQQANGLLLAVCEKLDPNRLFIEPSSAHSNKFIVQCQITIARLQDYCVMATRNMKHNDITLISEKKITISYNSTTTTSGPEDVEDDRPAKHTCRRDLGNTVLKSDIIRLETKVDQEKNTYDLSVENLNTAKFALDNAKTKAKGELGDQPDMVDNTDGAMTWMANFKAKIKSAQDYYDGKGRGAKQSCFTYNSACRTKLTEAIYELETKYKIARSVKELANYNFKNLDSLRRKCDIFIDIPAN